MRTFLALLRHRDGAAAAELALSIPIMLTLMFGSLELGNLFLDQHALSKQVRDGARFGSRLEIASGYACTSDPATVFEAGAAADDQIIKVTKDGVVSGAGKPRWNSYYWSRTCDDGGATVAVTIKCVSKDDIDTADTGHTGIYTSLAGDIPVVKVSGAVKYQSILSAVGFDATDVCLKAESEAAVAGI